MEHHRPDPPQEWIEAVAPLASTLLRERPELALPTPFRSLRIDRLEEGPALLLDDLSEIPRLGGRDNARYYQDRARLRAGDSDVLATCSDPVPGMEDYFRDHLGLGSPEWLRPAHLREPLRIAEACWEDHTTRTRLLERMGTGELRYIHPQMGTFSSWELAFLLQHESRRPLGVIAPPPGLTRWVNDKIAFTGTVERLFGPDLVPRTESAFNLAYLAKRVSDMARESTSMGLKLPNAVGGQGNFVVNAAEIRGCSLKSIREKLRECLQNLEWDGASAVLIDRWETDVVSSPSAQLWIPPPADGPPVMEGVFEQTIKGTHGCFVGNAPARLPERLEKEIVDRCWVLGLLFQTLGYVGRCSFDMILVGSSTDDCRLELIECNGRWGGTSLPMTLMNRIFGDWRLHPFSVRVIHRIPGLERVSFAEVMDWFRDDLFDIRTGEGTLIFLNPGRLRVEGGITVLAIGDPEQQTVAATDRIPLQLRLLAETCSPRTEADHQQQTTQ